MPEGPDQLKAVGVAAKAWVQKDPVAAFTWMIALPPRLYDSARMTASAAAGSPDVKVAGDFLISQTSDRVTMILHGLMIGWAMKDPAAAEAWCTQIQTTRDFRYACVFSVADGVCRKKATDAAVWAATLTQPDDRAAAIDGTATIWCRGGLADATAWIKQLNPTDMRWAAKSVAASWGLAKVKTDPSLEVWLNQLSLSAADKEDVLKGPRFDSFHISKYQPPPVPPANKP
jgi:hypothetical protein